MTTDKNVNIKVETPRIRRSPEVARENILAAAEIILRDHGPMELKLTEVAKAAGVATSTVLHHFESIGSVQTALMEKMIAELVARVIEATESAAENSWGTETDITLFDAFEEAGVARLAAWLVMTGEVARLSIVRRAVDDVVERTMRRQSKTLPRAVLEEMVLVSLTVALGAGMFGQALSSLLGKPAGSARAAALLALDARHREVGVL
jgi:AcrR family transcriptional regulator